MKKLVDKIMARRQTAIAAAEKELHGIIAGSFFPRQMQGRRRYCLSRMKDGKQRQVYVSGKDADAVAGGVRRYTELMTLLREIGELNLELIKRGVALDD
jgi:hypothetical protein